MEFLVGQNRKQRLQQKSPAAVNQNLTSSRLVEIGVDYMKFRFNYNFKINNVVPTYQTYLSI